MAYLERPDAKVYFEDTGTGIPIVLSHGFAATAVMWDKQLHALADRYRIIRWDMRGHGRTKTANDRRAYTPQHVLADMQAMLDHCQGDKAVMAGLSLGGYLSIALTERGNPCPAWTNWAFSIMKAQQAWQQQRCACDSVQGRQFLAASRRLYFFATVQE